jgi:hypothetical protein
MVRRHIRNGTWKSSPRPKLRGAVARPITLPRRRSCQSHLLVATSTADTPMSTQASALPTGVNWSAPIPGTVLPMRRHPNGVIGSDLEAVLAESASLRAESRRLRHEYERLVQEAILHHQHALPAFPGA